MKRFCAGILAAVFLCAITACSSFLPKLYTPNPDDVYKHDLRLEVNGAVINGVGVVRYAPEYRVRVYPPGKIDRIMWRTCNREETVDKPDTGWFSNRYEFTIAPVQGFEDVNSCALSITVLEEKKRRNGFAMVEFEDRRPEVKLEASVACNGVVTKANGVSICQSASGLIQQISFAVPVVQKGASPECDVMRPLDSDEKTYRFAIAKGECSYYFVAQERASNGKRYVHRLTTIGYSDVPPIKL